MRWFYAVGKEKVGPLTKDDIEKLAGEGKITPSTLVWADGMKNWTPYGEINPGVPEVKTAEPVGVGPLVCSECGGSFPADETVKYGKLVICASCKPAFFQKVKEGRSTASTMKYGGFWIRFGAKFLDNIITSLAYLAFAFLLGFLIQDNPESAAAALSIVFVQFAIPIFYNTYFLGKYQATPGKMAAGLIVVSPEGESISYGRAFGRYFAEMLSGLILGIGYFMAAFDEEKRSLHDRICSTRVVKK
ncbi:MAG: RDD family protein [Deltaproteobacteria bacterium]|nr:RDD family protein [Deltaproteobacteria bacterium]